MPLRVGLFVDRGHGQGLSQRSLEEGSSTPAVKFLRDGKKLLAGPYQRPFSKHLDQIGFDGPRNRGKRTAGWLAPRMIPLPEGAVPSALRKALATGSGDGATGSMEAKGSSRLSGTVAGGDARLVRGGAVGIR